MQGMLPPPAAVILISVTAMVFAFLDYWCTRKFLPGHLPASVFSYLM
jgi:hypothetical protein